MKYLNLFYFIIATLLCQLTSCGEQKSNSSHISESTEMSSSVHSDKTTFILVRHAEKDTIKGDPELTTLGHERAADLAKMLDDLPITAIYSSDYKRTKQTAAPSATAKNLEINIYNPGELEITAQEILKKHTNGVVLVVGHSNSTPNFVNILLGENQIEPIDESDYDNLFIVHATKIASAEVFHLHYGK